MSAKTITAGQLHGGCQPPIRCVPAEAGRIFNESAKDGMVDSAEVKALFKAVDFLSSLQVPPTAQFEACDADGLRGDEVLLSALAASSVQSVSLAGCAQNLGEKSAQFADKLINDVFSLERLDLTAAGVSTAGAKVLSSSLPGNRSVKTLILASNSIGDDAAKRLAEGISRSNVQFLSFRRCDIKESASIAAIVRSLAKCSSLVAVDLRMNPGYDMTISSVADALLSLETALKANAQGLYPRHEIVIKSFAESANEEDAAADDPVSALAGADGAGAAGDGDGDGDAGDETESQAAARAAGGGKNAPPHPSVPRMSKEEFEYSLRRWKRKDPIPTSGRKKSLEPTSQARALSPADRRSISLAEAPIKDPSQTGRKDILHDVERWKDVKAQYNSYICASPARTADMEKNLSEMRKRALAKPTFVMGKRVDNQYRSTSAPFRGKPAAIVREATPKDVQRNAPWMNQPRPVAGGTVPEGYVPPAVGQRTRIVTGYTDSGVPIVRSVRDGGEQTYINPLKDPRDMGFYAQRVQAKEVKPQEPWRRSASKREVRFGVSEKDPGFLQREAQAPDNIVPLRDEWAETAKKLRDRAKLRERSATGQKLMGGTAAPRSSIGPSGQCSGEFLYEVP